MMKRSAFCCLLILFAISQPRDARASNVASVVIYIVSESSLMHVPDVEMSYYTVDLLDSEDDLSMMSVAIRYIPTGSRERSRSITAMLNKDTPEEDRLTLKLTSFSAMFDDEISLSTTAHEVIKNLSESKSTVHARISYESGTPSRPQEMSDRYQLTYTLTDSF